VAVSRGRGVQTYPTRRSSDLAREIDGLVGPQLDAHDVALAGDRVGLAGTGHRRDPRAGRDDAFGKEESERELLVVAGRAHRDRQDRKSTRLNSSHVKISYAVF